MVALHENPAHIELEDRLTRVHYALHETETKLSRERTAHEALERTVHAAHLAEQAFLGAGLLLVLLDADGRIVRVNPACEQLSGKAERTLCGEHFWMALVTPDETANAQHAFAEALTATFHSCRLVLAGADTSRRAVEWTLTVQQNVDGAVEYLVAVGRA
jgi:PAS domain S-box-containing protein